MKESEARLLASHNAVKEVAIVRAQSGARKTSQEGGWLCKINGEALASARKPVRVFASLDTACEALNELGIYEFRIDSKQAE